MACEACSVKFSFFKRKRRCMDCLRYFCSECVIRRVDKTISCDSCSILSRRPLVRGQVAQIRSRDLRQYLMAKKVCVRGCVEKDDLVKLLLLHANGDYDGHTDGEAKFRSEYAESFHERANRHFQPSEASDSSDTLLNRSNQSSSGESSEFGNVEHTRTHLFGNRRNGNSLLEGTASPVFQSYSTGQENVRIESPVNESNDDAVSMAEDVVENMVATAVRNREDVALSPNLTLQTEGSTGQESYQQECRSQMRWGGLGAENTNISSTSESSSITNVNIAADATNSSTASVATTATVAATTSTTSTTTTTISSSASSSTTTTTTATTTSTSTTAAAAATTNSGYSNSSTHNSNVEIEELSGSDFSPTEGPEPLVTEVDDFVNDATTSNAATSDIDYTCSVDSTITEAERVRQSPVVTEVPVVRWQGTVTLSDITHLSDLDHLNVKQLKNLLSTNGVYYKGCIERSELMERAARLWEQHKQSQIDIEQMEEEDVCKICWDAPIECVILECGHMACCLNCGKQMSECPICKQYVVRVVRFFKA